MESGTGPFGSGGQLLIDNKGDQYSQNVYVRWDDSGHHGTGSHYNISLISRDWQTGRTHKTTLIDSHLIEVGDLPKPIYIKTSFYSL